MVDTYRARRRLKVTPEHWREPGELLPEAHLIFRLDSLLHTGMITEAKGIEDQEFQEAVQRYCPEQAEQIFDLVGLTGAGLTGPRNTPRKRAVRARS